MELVLPTLLALACAAAVGLGIVLGRLGRRVTGRAPLLLGMLGLAVCVAGVVHRLQAAVRQDDFGVIAHQVGAIAWGLGVVAFATALLVRRRGSRADTR